MRRTLQKSKFSLDCRIVLVLLSPILLVPNKALGSAVVPLELLLNINGWSDSGTIGFYLSPLGDINGDGFDDFGAMMSNPPGTYVFFGGNPPDTVPDMRLPLGWGIGGTDYDGDGIQDVLLRSWYDGGLNIPDDDWVYVLKGYGDSLGSLPVDSLNVLKNSGSYLRFEVGDVDGDPYSDFLVDSWSADDSDRVRLFRSPFLDKNPVWTFSLLRRQLYLTSVGFIDFNGDSHTDIFLSLLPDQDTSHGVYIFFGPNFDQTPNLIIHPPERVGRLEIADTLRFGEFCSNVGDLNDDGFNDLFVSFPLFGLVYFSQAGGDATYDRLLENLTHSMVAAGDVNGDGYDDMFGGSGVYFFVGGVDAYLGHPTFNPNVDAYISGTGLPPGLQWDVGYVCSRCGDVNGDGYNELMFSSTDFQGHNYGDVWIMKGSSGLVTDVGSVIDESIPSVVQLSPTYPNPAAADVQIGVNLPVRGMVTVEVYDILGRKVRNVFTGEMSAGRHTFVWNGNDEHETRLPSGVYFCRLHSLGQFETRKLTLLR